MGLVHPGAVEILKFREEFMLVILTRLEKM